MKPDIPPQMVRAEAARHRAALAKTDLLNTVGELKARMAPAAIAKRTADTVTDKAVGGATKARTAAQSRPLMTGMIAAGIGIAAGLGLRRKLKKGTHHDG
ncbi:MAG: hypothetical protein V2J26_08505 [Pacificimonas sp.]|jgi:hypothetical protein|nr:hypothetical protein [Pacificimonas sp.]